MDKFLKGNKNLLYTILALVIFVELIAGYFYIVSPIKKESEVVPPSSPPVKKAAASLTLLPSSAAYKVGGSFDVTINLDTDKGLTVGTDLIVSYDAKKLEVVDADLTKPGVQIQAGSLYDTNPVNIEKAGKIYLGAIASPGKKQFAGSGTLAVIKFKGKTAGQAGVTIDFTPGLTTDSNVTTADSRDILAKVGNATFSVTP